MKKKYFYINVTIWIISLFVFALILAIHSGIISTNPENSIIEIATSFNIYFVVLSLFYISQIFLKVSIILCYPNKFIFLPISRFSFFLREYRNICFNVPVLVLSSGVFFLIILLNLNIFNSIQVFRLFVLYALQFHVLHWLILLLKNILKENIANLVSIIILMHLFTAAAMALKQPILLLNPLTGWLMIPEIYNYRLPEFIVFIVLVLIINIILFVYTRKAVRWNL